MNTIESANFAQDQDPQVGESGTVPGKADNDPSLQSTPQNKKTSLSSTFNKKGLYFESGVSFNEVRRLIDQMRARIKPDFCEKNKKGY